MPATGTNADPVDEELAALRAALWVTAADRAQFGDGSEAGPSGMQATPVVDSCTLCVCKLLQL